jgi:hypothetical protein
LIARYQDVILQAEVVVLELSLERIAFVPIRRVRAGHRIAARQLEAAGEPPRQLNLQ